MKSLWQVLAVVIAIFAVVQTVDRSKNVSTETDAVSPIQDPHPGT
jgi:hypothetical protein